MHGKTTQLEQQYDKLRYENIGSTKGQYNIHETKTPCCYGETTTLDRVVVELVADRAKS
jgi:hypothetical protein